ncbi:hypothetical protein KVT40_002098 [Elsinoe batatas]|uniref:Uncharacterized protein n=1 Tax=Elsinoe batatas TaxID=2601811 RepID=A0A8K0PLZ0_9PEZI|nr:hypothetical protein KVT40_002098 [Elsinoe batatas]
MKRTICPWLAQTARKTCHRAISTSQVRLEDDSPRRRHSKEDNPAWSGETFKDIFDSFDPGSVPKNPSSEGPIDSASARDELGDARSTRGRQSSPRARTPRPGRAPVVRQPEERNPHGSILDNFKPSEDGTRTVRPRISRDKALPLPPFMDPRVQEARFQHRERKPLQSKEDLTPLQQDIANNPYAAVFLTHMRQDALTDLILPRFFLQSFSTVFPPPKDTRTKSTPPSPREPAPPTDSFPSLPIEHPSFAPSSPSPSPSPSVSPSPPPPPPSKAAPTPKPTLHPTPLSSRFSGPKSYTHLPLTSLSSLHESKRWKNLPTQAMERHFNLERRQWGFSVKEARFHSERLAREEARRALGGAGWGGWLTPITVELAKAASGGARLGGLGRAEGKGEDEGSEESWEGKKALVILAPPPEGQGTEEWINTLAEAVQGGVEREWIFFLPALMGQERGAGERMQMFRWGIGRKMENGVRDRRVSHNVEGGERQGSMRQEGERRGDVAGDMAWEREEAAPRLDTDGLLAVVFKVEGKTMESLLQLMRLEMLYAEGAKWDVHEKEQIWRRWEEEGRQYFHKEGRRESRPRINERQGRRTV